MGRLIIGKEKRERISVMLRPSNRRLLINYCKKNGHKISDVIEYLLEKFIVDEGLKIKRSDKDELKKTKKT